MVLDARRIKPSLLPPAYFLVDGDDWLAHILVSKGLKNNSVDNVELGNVICQLYSNLHQMGIQPIVFLERTTQKSKKTSKHASHDGADLTDPQKVQLLQLRETLRSLKVDIEECNSIQRAGAMLKFSKDMAISCYFYGSPSSDLWAVKDVSYILFDTVSITDEHLVQAPVWNRTVVAAALFITEKQLAELMILVGNRYTKPFGRRGLRTAIGANVPNTFFETGEEIKGVRMKSREIKPDDMISLAAMRDWILLQGANFTFKFSDRPPRIPVISPFSSAEKAMQYSRVYYENGDLSAFHDEMDEGMEMGAIVSKNEVTFLPTSSNAAAAIMAAISGSSSGQGRSVTANNKKTMELEPEKESEPIERKNKKRDDKRDEKRDDVRMATIIKSDDREVRTTEGRRGKKDVLEKAPERTIEKGGKRDRNDNGKEEVSRSSTVGAGFAQIAANNAAATAAARASTSTAVPVTATATGTRSRTVAITKDTRTGGARTVEPVVAPAVADVDKGEQLKNLLGMKFGASLFSKATAIPATAAVAVTADEVSSTSETSPSLKPDKNTQSRALYVPLQRALRRDSEVLKKEEKETPSRKVVTEGNGERTREKGTREKKNKGQDSAMVPSSSPPASSLPMIDCEDLSLSEAYDSNSTPSASATPPFPSSDARVRGSAPQSSLPSSSPSPSSSPFRNVKAPFSRNSATSSFSSSSSSVSLTQTVLPIDAHREKILNHIAEHRVTIIHGMTGCGKSSRYVHKATRTNTHTHTCTYVQSH